MNRITRSMVLLERLFSAYGSPGFTESAENQYILETDNILFYFFDEPEQSELYIQADIAEYTGHGDHGGAYRPAENESSVGCHRRRDHRPVRRKQRFYLYL